MTTPEHDQNIGDDEQRRERRIGVLRQVVSFMRDKRNAPRDAFESWATELERMADVESTAAHARSSRTAYRHVMTYLRQEIGLTREFVTEYLDRAIAKACGEALDRYVARSIERFKVDSARVERVIETAITNIVREQVTARARELLHANLKITVG